MKIRFNFTVNYGNGTRIQYNIKNNILVCDSFTDLTIIGYNGLNPIISKSGEMCLVIKNPKEFSNSVKLENTNYVLTYDKMNISSLLFINDLSISKAYGYPNPYMKLKNGDDNPFYTFRNDLYLFNVNSDCTNLEMFIIPNGKSEQKSLFKKFIDGGFDEQIEKLIVLSKPFINNNEQ